MTRTWRFPFLVRSLVVLADCCGLVSFCVIGAEQDGQHELEIPRAAISAEELDNRIIFQGEAVISSLRVTNRWLGKPLVNLTDRTIVFQGVAFDGGIVLSDLIINSKLHFDQCTFSIPVERGGLDSAIRNCWFGRPITFRNCRFERKFSIQRSFFRDILFLQESRFNDALEMDDVYFSSTVRFTALHLFEDALFVFNAQQLVDLSRTDMRKSVKFENCKIRGGLDISGVVATSTNAFLSFNEVTLVGGINASQLFAEMNGASWALDERGRCWTTRRLRLSSTTFDLFRGLSWREFQALFTAERVQDWFSVLPLLRKSYESQGDLPDADAVLLKVKQLKAAEGNVLDKAFHFFMSISSGWGTRPLRLLAWFWFVVVLFGTVYFFELGPHAKLEIGTKSAHGVYHQCKCLLICGSVSFGLTLLQYEHDDWLELIAAGRKDKAIEAVRGTIRLHKMVAAVFLMMVGGYIGAQFAG